MLTIDNLTKSFDGLVAVDRISFDVREGEIFGVLGPNGAGKSTTINMIASLLKPDGGSISLDGQDIATLGERYRRALGLVPQEVALYEELSARENLGFWSSLYGLRGAQKRDRIDEVLHLAGLADRAGDPVKSYSGGMKRRLNMAIGTGQFLEQLVNRGFVIENLSIKEPSLDSVFIKLTGRELRD